MSVRIVLAVATSVVLLATLPAGLFAQRIYIGTTSISGTGVISAVDIRAQAAMATVTSGYGDIGAMTSDPGGAQAWVLLYGDPLVRELDPFLVLGTKRAPASLRAHFRIHANNSSS